MAINVDNIKEIKLKIDTSDGMYNLGSDYYLIQFSNNKYVVSYIEDAYWGINGYPHNEDINKVYILKSPMIDNYINQMLEELLCYPHHKYNNDIITIELDNEAYEIDLNEITANSVYQLLLIFNLTPLFKLNNLSTMIKQLVQQHKEITKGVCVSTELKHKKESKYQFHFSYLNKQNCSLIEIAIDFNEKYNKDDLGDKILTKTTYKNNGIYQIAEKERTYKKRDYLKDELINLFNYYTSLYDASLHDDNIEDDYCSINYNDQIIKFPRTILKQSSYDLLNYLYQGENDLPIKIEIEQNDNCSKFKYYRNVNIKLPINFGSNDPNIKYLLFTDSGLFINDGCYSNCPNLNEIRIIPVWFGYSDDHYIIKNTAFNNSKTKDIIKGWN